MWRVEDELSRGVYDEVDVRNWKHIAMWIATLLWFAVAIISVMGCSTTNLSNCILVNSTLSQDKPIRAGISTTGEALGEMIKAAGFGNPISIDEIKQMIDALKSLRQQQSMIHPFKWECKRCVA